MESSEPKFVEDKQEKDLIMTSDSLSSTPSDLSEMSRRFSIDSGISSPSTESSRRRSLGTQTPSGSMLFDFSFDSSDPGNNIDDEQSDAGDGDLRPRSTTVSFPVRRRGSITHAEIEKFKQNVLTSSSGILSSSAPASDSNAQLWKHSGSMLRALADDYSNRRAGRPRRNSEPYCQII